MLEDVLKWAWQVTTAQIKHNPKLGQGEGTAWIVEMRVYKSHGSGRGPGWASQTWETNKKDINNNKTKEPEANMVLQKAERQAEMDNLFQMRHKLSTSQGACDTMDLVSLWASLLFFWRRVHRPQQPLSSNCRKQKPNPLRWTPFPPSNKTRTYTESSGQITQPKFPELIS